MKLLHSIQEILQSAGHILRLLWQAHARAFSLTVVLYAVQGVLPLAAAWILKSIFDFLQAGQFDPAYLLQPALLLLIALQGIVVFSRELSQPTMQYFQGELERQATKRVQSHVYTRVNSFQGVAYFENLEMHNKIRLAHEGVRFGVRQTLWLLVSLFQNTITLLGFIGILLAFSPLLAGLVMAAVLPHFYAYLTLGRQRYRLIYQVSPDERQKSYFCTDTTTLLTNPRAAKELRLFGVGQYLLDRLLHLFDRVHYRERQQQRRETFWKIGLGALSSLIGVLALAVVLVSAVRGQITIGDVSLYLAAVTSVQTALVTITASLSNLHESSLFYRYYTDLDALPEPLATPAPTTGPAVPPLQTGIEFRHVSFRYGPHLPWVLQEVNLHIPVGQCLGLVGANGAGKTTLVKLLLRLYDPTEGEILWDGVDIRHYAPQALRRRLSGIFQDFLQYDLTVQENVGMGDVAHIDNRERVRQAAQKSGAAGLITGLPHQYDTLLSLQYGNGDAGVELSGGQWQRLATARMLMREEADLLVLDEPTSALDAAAEHELYTSFAARMNHCTSIIISHRFSTLYMADKIAVLQDGRISEHGTHQELLDSEGAYARLYRLQAQKYNGQMEPKVEIA
jgi:ATP-binding cassette, subfamily B, bacterial